MAMSLTSPPRRNGSGGSRDPFPDPGSRVYSRPLVSGGSREVEDNMFCGAKREEEMWLQHH